MAFVDDLGAEFTADMVVVDQTLAGKLLLTPDKKVVESIHYTRKNDISIISAAIKAVSVHAKPFKPNLPDSVHRQDNP